MTIWPTVLVFGSLLLFVAVVSVGVAYLVRRQRQSDAPEIVGGDTVRSVAYTGSESNSLPD